MRQHGNVTRRQLLAVGVSDDAIALRVRAGRLYRVHRGVYAVGRRPVTMLERAAAAVLACGEKASLSDLCALAHWGLAAKWPGRFEVTVVRHRCPRGITVHRRTLHRRDVRVHLGIRVTSPARTLLDCTPGLTDKALTRAVNDARHARLTSPPALTEIISRNPNHPGTTRLKPFANPQSPFTASPFEDRFRALCQTYGLPTPQFNTTACGYQVDALFAPEKLIVELDSWEFHQDRTAFITDRARDADTLEAGYATLRITWERPDEQEAARLHRILAARQ